MNQVKLYSKNNIMQKTDATYLLDNYLRLVKFKKSEKEKFFDIGSGDGSVTMELLLPRIPENFAKFVGCDISEDMVKFSKSKVVDPRIDFVILDIENNSLPIKMVNEFDHVFSFYCLHWIQNQKQAFQNIYNMMAPGGDLLTIFLASNPIYDIYESMAANEKWLPYMKNFKSYISPYHFYDQPLKELEKILKEAGFSIHLCRLENRNFTFNSLDVMERATKAVNPFLENIPEDKLENYLNDFVEEVRKLNSARIINGNNNNNNEGRVYFTYKLFVVFASKPDKN
ncbi:unnamed protein product [Brassicogethes aeneus]|uniref:Methyltransferase type 11 domain-containing protein n=1 Tax=Brassicogethes aeneus TaxID=1431903 RepID=A0A9P0BDK6_BRAAE|nr:unnamed protein product [Brassicogethes aeneus]